MNKDYKKEYEEAIKETHWFNCIESAHAWSKLKLEILLALPMFTRRFTDTKIIELQKEILFFEKIIAHPIDDFEKGTFSPLNR